MLSKIGKSIDAYTIVRVLLGMLLLVAGILKGYQLATEPTANTDLFTNKLFLMLLVEGELLFGIWLLFGAAVQQTRLVSIVLFSVFAIISLGRAVSGQASCGCFGSLSVSPWITTLIDLAAVAALWRCRPIPTTTNARRALVNVPAILVSWLLLGAPLGAAMHSFEPNSIDEFGGFTTSGDLILLEPEKWVDGSFALAKHIIETDADLSDGDWVVMLFHHDCPKCQEALPKYHELAKTLQSSNDKTRVALIEVPPFGSDQRQDSPAHYGRLPEAKDWFVQAPVEIQISGSNVIGVSNELDSIKQFQMHEALDLASVNH